MKLFLTAATAAILALAPLGGNAQTRPYPFGNMPVIKGNSPKFIWTDWAKAPQSLKDATKLINTDTGETLFAFIQSVLSENLSIKPHVDIAVIDLNQDGVLGIAVHLLSRTWCGTAGCQYELYENAGIIYVSLSDSDIKPASYGVKSSANKFFGMDANKKCQYKGINDTPKIFITKELY